MKSSGTYDEVAFHGTWQCILQDPQTNRALRIAQQLGHANTYTQYVRVCVCLSRSGCDNYHYVTNCRDYLTVQWKFPKWIMSVMNVPSTYAGKNTRSLIAKSYVYVFTLCDTRPASGNSLMPSRGRFFFHNMKIKQSSNCARCCCYI